MSIFSRKSYKLMVITKIKLPGNIISYICYFCSTESSLILFHFIYPLVAKPGEVLLLAPVAALSTCQSVQFAEKAMDILKRKLNDNLITIFFIF